MTSNKFKAIYPSVWFLMFVLLWIPCGYSGLPQKKYTGDREKEEFRRVLREADVIFEAKVKKIDFLSVGHPPMPLIRVELQNLETLKGETPIQRVFRYSRAPDAMRFGRGMRILGCLKKIKGEFILDDAMDKDKLQMANVRAAVTASGPGPLTEAAFESFWKD